MDPIKVMAVLIITTHRAGHHDEVKFTLDHADSDELEQLMNELTANHFSGYEECQAFRDTYNF